MCTSVCVCTCFPERKHLLQSVRGHLSEPAVRGPQDLTPRPEDVEEQLPRRTVTQPPSDTQPDESLACEMGMPQEIFSGSHTSAQFITPQRARDCTKCSETLMKVTNADLEQSALIIKTANYTAGNTLQTRRGPCSVCLYIY